ncbi:MAG: hypothetical protein WCH39_06420 [Schlesneria sp.]
MRSVPLAMTWEMLQRGRWYLIACFLGAQLILSIVFGALASAGVDFEDPSIVGVGASFLLTYMFLFSVSALAYQGPPSRLYTYPITSSTIVSGHLLVSMASVGFQLWLSIFLMNTFFKTHWPVWGPVLFAAAAVCSIQATMWLTEKSAWAPLAIAVVAGLLGCWYHFRCVVGSGISRSTVLWTSVTLADLAGFLAVTTASFVFGNFAMTRNRCGEQLKPLGIHAWLCRVLDFAHDEKALPFRSPAEAQLWYEWRLKGWGMPATVVLGLFFLMAVWLIFVRDPKLIGTGFLMLGGYLSVPGLVCAFIIGNTGRLDTDFEMGHFLGSRPMKSDEMARTILKMTAQSLLLAFSLWAGAFLVTAVILLGYGLTPGDIIPKEIPWWSFLAAPLGCWTVITVLASIGLTGRPVLFAKICCAMLALYMASLFFSVFVLTEKGRDEFFTGVALIISAVLLSGTAWLFITALRRQLIQLPSAAACAFIWIVLSSLCVLIGSQYPGGELLNYFTLVALVALVVAPIAAAPLAVSWNRTR